MATIKWEAAGNGHPGDQEADSNCVDHGYWSLGCDDGGTWTVELIEQAEHTLDEIVTGGVDLGSFDSEQEAKAAAQLHEDKFS